MRFLVLLLVFAFSQGPTPTPREAGKSEQEQSLASHPQASSEQRGTDQSALAIKIVPSGETSQESARETEDRKQKSANDRWLIIFNGILALIAFGQLVVYGYQAKKLRETVEASEKQSEAIEAQVVEMRSTGKQTDKLIQENIAQSASMAESVKETARFASAMEGVSKSLEITAEASRQAADASAQSIASLRKQMRAYLTVTISGGIPQSQESNARFDVRPLLVNAGPTPARNVRHRIKAAILPIPLPGDFDDTIETENEEGGNMMGAHQNAQMMGIVEDYVPEDQIEDIKTGKGPGVYAWGIVTYEDVFGESHTTKFCQRLTYLPNGNVFGYYIPGRNDAD